MHKKGFQSFAKIFQVNLVISLPRFGKNSKNIIKKNYGLQKQQIHMPQI